jgi:hypothetical protein
MPPTSPSRPAQRPFFPPSSPTTRQQQIFRPELGGRNVVIPASLPRPGLTTLDARGRPSITPSVTPPSTTIVRLGSPHSFREPRPAPMPPRAPAHHPVRSTSSSTSSHYPPPEFDTKTGGAAGMAGVGRRGFAAVAHAAMFATSRASDSDSPTATAPLPGSWVPVSSPPQGMSPFHSFSIITR